jgi:hypothetical protein
MKYNALYISIALLAAVWSIYFYSFHGPLSPTQADWGTFGDFTGGVINPLLNFITIYLLITQYRVSREDMLLEREDADIKAFESSFFNFTTIALSEYRNFEISEGGRVFKGAEAVSVIQKRIEAIGASGEISARQELINMDRNSHDAIYSLVAGFCVIFRLIQDSCPSQAKQKYTQTLSMLLPIKITYLLCVCETCSSWGMLDHPRDLGYYDKESVKFVLEHYRTIAQNTANL